MVHDLVGAVVVRIGRIVNGVVGRVVGRTIVIHRRRTVRRRGKDGDRAHTGAVAAKVVIGQHVDIHRRILIGHLVRVIDRRRHIINRINRDIYGCLVAISIGVADFVNDLVGAVVIGIRRIIDGIIGRVRGRSVVVYNSRTIGRRSHDGDRSHARAVAAKVVVGQRIDVERGIFRCGCHVVHSIRQVIDRIDGHGGYRLVAVAVAVTDFVGKHIGSVVVRIRGIVYRIIRRIVRRAVVINHRRTIRRLYNYGNGARTRAVAAEVVIGQYIDVHRRILIGRLVRVIHCIRHIIDRIDRNAYRRLVAIAVGITDLVNDLVGAVVIGIRRIVDGVIGRIGGRAVVVHRRRTIGGRGHDGDRAAGRAFASEVVIH